MWSQCSKSRLPAHDPLQRAEAQIAPRSPSGFVARSPRCLTNTPAVTIHAGYRAAPDERAASASICLDRLCVHAAAEFEVKHAGVY